MTVNSLLPASQEPAQETTKDAAEARSQLATFIEGVKSHKAESARVIAQLGARIEELQVALSAAHDENAVLIGERDTLKSEYQVLLKAHDDLFEEFKALLDSVNSAVMTHEGDDDLMRAAFAVSEAAAEQGQRVKISSPHLDEFLNLNSPKS